MSDGVELFVGISWIRVHASRQVNGNESQFHENYV